MRVAWFTPLRPACAEARHDVESLLPAIARDVDVTVLTHTDGAGGEGPAGITVHDLGRIHYRKVLWQFDLVVYALTDGPDLDDMADALREWPGIVLAYAIDLDPLFRRRPELRRAVLDASLLLAVGSDEQVARIRRESPFTTLASLPRSGSIDDRARACRDLFEEALRARDRWLEPLLEAACAEMPGWLPADRLAPWHPHVAELVSLVRPSKPRA